ncbi:MAG: TonB-dependent receptor [Candidatus Cloacimonetes bacterium]|nr:TonB-dependent receptor [Candidatus Cloacimonadota bacterium]
MKKKFLLLTTLFVSLISLCSALTLKGVVLDKTSGNPIPNVIVTAGDYKLMTPENGTFSIELPNTKEIDVTFERIGYKPQTKDCNNETKYLKISMKRDAIELSGIKVATTRVTTKTSPITFTNIEQEEILESNHGQDIPLLIDDVPNVYTYSEAGSALGYSHMKVRGFDERRIGIMVNGIPFNDPEDHSVYWVDMPDLAESVENIQFQKGVGNSQYGVSTFGGSLNLMTNSLNNSYLAEISTNYGSFNTWKYSAKTSLDISKKLKTTIRFSQMASDGYRDNSASEMWSYFFNLSYIGKSSVTEFNTYGGNEKTHAAWYASPVAELEANPQYNSRTYENEIDNFSQPHYELHNRWNLNDKLLWQNSAFYIHGRGYYEQLKEGGDLYYYSLITEENDSEADVIRQKWVQKDQMGLVSNLTWQHYGGDLTFGTYLCTFSSDHWGEVKNVTNAVDAVGNPLTLTYTAGQKYHQYTGDKQYLTFYANENYNITESLSAMINLHYQGIKYIFEQKQVGNFTGENLNSYEVDYHFFNPRFGLNYSITEDLNIYGNVSLAQREPADQELYNIWDDASDLGTQPLFHNQTAILDTDGNILRYEWEDPYVKPEKVINYEIGQRFSAEGWDFETAMFWMDFTNEIVRFGGVDSDGYPNMGNADKTIHRGVEFSMKKEFFSNLKLSGNVSLNDNYFKEFEAYDTDWDTYETYVVDYSGNKISNSPDMIANAGMSYTWKWVTASLDYRYVGEQYLDNTQNPNRTVPEYSLINAGFTVKLPEMSIVNSTVITFKINNLLDKRYYTDGYYDAWDGGNNYWIGAERNFMIGFRTRI